MTVTTIKRLPADEHAATLLRPTSGAPRIHKLMTLSGLVAAGTEIDQCRADVAMELSITSDKLHGRLAAANFFSAVSSE